MRVSKRVRGEAPSARVNRAAARAEAVRRHAHAAKALASRPPAAKGLPLSGFRVQVPDTERMTCLAALSACLVKRWGTMIAGHAHLFFHLIQAVMNQGWCDWSSLPLVAMC